MIKDFLVTIIAYGYHTKFPVKAIDTPEAIEQSIVDKLGKNEVIFDTDGFTCKIGKWITYEEVIYDPRPIQTKEVLGVKLGAGV